MKIVGLHLEHDASVCLIEDGSLRLSIEAEKDSHRRFSTFDPDRLAEAFAAIDFPVDVMARAGWKEVPGDTAGYEGVETGPWSQRDLGGATIDQYSCSHERAHVVCSYGLAPWQQGQPCYALCWEGTLGAWYHVGANLEIRRLATPLDRPGHRYSFLYELADPGRDDTSCGYDGDAAGKLMALAAYGSDTEPDSEAETLCRDLLTSFGRDKFSKADYRDSSFFNLGVEHPRFKNVAARFSTALFDRFFEAARAHCDQPLPLLVSGGCGLNGDWNSRWERCGLFTDVFVPPCTNDTGVAIGAAVDAQWLRTGSAKITWQIASGEPFVKDADGCDGYRRERLDTRRVAELLMRGGVIALVQGRCEMGPRALGQRSLLAAPFDPAIRDRLNRIKQREPFRPVAPVCLEADAERWFGSSKPRPYMLFFERPTTDRLGAVTHVDGSARLQTVGPEAQPWLAELLGAFGALTGCPVLCNTSLNFPRHGFINRATDLFRYATSVGLDAIIIEDALYVRDN
jgi:predicted NodU family carbamoyl transferase